MPELNDILPLPAENKAVSKFLENRRSNLAKGHGGARSE